MSTLRRNVRCPSARSLRSRAGTDARAFTLLETALATIIIGVGVLAMVEAQQSFIRSNAWSSQAATATYLANEIREMTRRLPRHDPVNGLTLTTSGGSTVLTGWGPEPGEVNAVDYNDVDDFDGLRLAFNGTPGRTDGDLPGPVDAFGNLIPEIGNDGQVEVDAQNRPLPLQGWTQRITVVKVNPFNPSVTYAPDAVLAPVAGGFRGLSVDQFPLRVSVDVFFRGPNDTAEQIITTVTWIAP
jgi:type II secretory pathway pseudopilin PulG